jgi:hypothetical protein
MGGALERLQEANMKHIMNSCIFWECKAIRNFASPSRDLIRSNILW